MTARVLVDVRHPHPYWNLPAAERARLEEACPDVVVRTAGDALDTNATLAEATVFFGWSLSPGEFAAAPALRWVHSPATGVRRFLYPELVASDVVLTSSRGVHAPFLAEQVMAWLLAHVRRLPRLRRAQESGEWIQGELLRDAPPGTLIGRTALLVGYGSTGAELARRLASFGVRILAVRRRPERGAEAADEVAMPEGVDDLLPRADIVVNLLPNTDATRGFFDRSRLARLAPGSFFCNVGRGMTVDEEALAAMLAEGRLAGAGLDVFEREPLPPDSPLWTEERAFLSPHVAGVGHPLLWPRLLDRFLENLERFRSGRELRGRVDKTAGY
jgi:phosphoglycerate dehydrogenase-like enzyme